ncbi:MAG: hypothetical protein ACRC6B_05505 [Fusobacteriaceae bacterium]
MIMRKRLSLRSICRLAKLSVELHQLKKELDSLDPSPENEKKILTIKERISDIKREMSLLELNRWSPF